MIGLSSVRVVINAKGVREILQSQRVRADLEGRAQRIAATAGPGMEAESSVGRARARASVRTATFEAMEAEARHRRLTRAIDAGR